MNAKQQLEAKFWLSLVIALWTIVGMALPLIAGETSIMGIIFGSASESGFYFLSLSSASEIIVSVYMPLSLSSFARKET